MSQMASQLIRSPTHKNAIGASPIMSNAPEEAEGIVTIAQAITINIGSLWTPQIQEMMALMTAAYQ